ncbi:MAG TPA: zinc ribbon domain-containing protein [Planctomycetota bacterium]|nr:zinc ribbon domain-containing protein [Planctomycetota bacterium]
MNAPSKCPKCGTAVPVGEKFCSSCGFQIQVSAADARDIGARIGLKHEKQTHQQRIRSGRTTILVVAILAFIGSVAVYFIASSELAKARREIDAARGNDQFDQEKVEEAAVEYRKSSRLVAILVGINVLLALCYLGLWFWAKVKPLPATLAALILFITVQVASAAIDPKELVRGLILKVIIIAFLIKAVDSARKYQRMQEHGV